MLKTLLTPICCIAAFMLGALYSPFRYEFHPLGNGYTIARCDRLTGEVYIGIMNGHWQEIKAPETDRGQK